MAKNKDSKSYVEEIVKFHKIKGYGQSHVIIKAVKPGHKSVIVKSLLFNPDKRFSVEKLLDNQIFDSIRVKSNEKSASKMIRII